MLSLHLASPKFSSLQQESPSTLNDVILKLPCNIKISPEGLAAILDHAAKNSDIGVLKMMHKKAHVDGIPLVAASYEALVRGYASNGDVRAVKVFEEMVSHGFELSDSA